MKTKHLRRRLLRGLIVAVWVAMSIMFVTSGVPFRSADEGVAAQSSDVTFVKNIGQATEVLTILGNPEKRVGHHTSSQFLRQAIAFETGDNLGGYTLGSLPVEFLALADGSYMPQVTIHTDSSGKPAVDALYALVAPNTLPTGAGTTQTTGDDNVVTLEMTAPADATLTAGALYWGVFQNTGTTSANRYEINTTAATAEDSGRLTGWSIADMRRRSTNGTTWTESAARSRWS